MRVISMVPSWTETLLTMSEKDSYEIVGRTRFCIHPFFPVKNIPIVGGTKKIDWDIANSLKADFLLLDRQENPEFMAQDSEIPVIDTHVHDLPSLAVSLRKIASALGSDNIAGLAERLEKILGMGKQNWQKEALRLLSADAKPGFQLSDLKNELNYSKPIPVNYVIWKDPWMSVSGATFIGAMMNYIGFANRYEKSTEKYPELFDEELLEGLNLFSSEPFPFAKKTDSLHQQQLKGLLIDGEPLSWFGLRSIRFLELLAASN